MTRLSEIKTMQATMTDDYRYAYLDLSNDIKRLLPWYIHDSKKKWLSWLEMSRFFEGKYI